jgi:hypothetical protein
MGLNFGGQSAQQSASTSGTSNSTSTPTYTSDQSGLQTMLSSLFKTLMPAATSGSISPNVQAMQTAGADQINKTSAGLGDRMQKFLAQRGFGSSGTSGKVALQGELGRESALGANASAASGLQLQQNSTMLADALAMAYANPGAVKSGTDSGTSSGTSSGSNWGASAAAAFGF